MNRKTDHKRPKAAAIQYSEGDKAPRVVASGVGYIARQILALARKNEIPITKDDGLASILSQLDIGYEIPTETYQAMAEILAFLYRTDEEWRKRKERDFTKALEGKLHSKVLLNSNEVLLDSNKVLLDSNEGEDCQ